MIYKGFFRDITDLDNLYEVRITTESGSALREITLGGTPFVTEMDSSDEIIYKPVKYLSGTIQFITPDYNFDIYNEKAQGTKVELINSAAGVCWTGYVTPNLYDMGFNEYRELVEIECIDALSSLLYIKYSTNNKKIISFLELIRKILRTCNAYTHFYFSNNTQISEQANTTILDKLYISEENFFDEKKDKEKDEDVAWTTLEVLEEICRFLGVTAIADGTSVYFLDYDAIRLGINTYYMYEVNTNNNPVLVERSFSKKIKGSDYSEGNAKLSLDNVYNKVVIKDDLYSFDMVIPDIYGNLNNITKDNDAYLSSQEALDNGTYGEVVQSKVDNGGDIVNNNMVIMIDRIWNPEDDTWGEFNAAFMKYFVNPNYKFYWYNGNLSGYTTSSSRINYSDCRDFHGAFIGKYCVKKLDRPYRWWDYIMNGGLDTWFTFDEWMARNEISSINFTDYIVLINSENNHISNDNITDYPYLETSITDTSALFGGDNAYLVLSGSYNYHYFGDDPYPIPEGESDIAEGRYAMDSGQTNLVARLLWGNLYWNGTTWTSTPSIFNIPYMNELAGGDERRADATMFKDLDFVNTVTWRIGTNEKGYLIPMPNNNNVATGLPKLTLYKPFDPNYHSTKSGDDEGQHYKHCCVFLKNFQLKALIGDPTYSNISETDTIYTNIINIDSVKKLDEIKFKVCTWDNKKPNYSCVAYKEGNNYRFLDKTYNRACAAGETNWSGSSGNGFRLEEHLIYRLVNQYYSPSVILELNLRNDNKIYGLYTDTTIDDRYFIVDNINIDWRMNKLEIKLIEKK